MGSSKELKERGFDFAFVIPAFTDPRRVVVDDLRREYGELRFRLYGHVEGRLFVVVFTVRDGAHRIISARKANIRERSRYDAGKIKS